MGKQQNESAIINDNIYTGCYVFKISGVKSMKEMGGCSNVEKSKTNKERSISRIRAHVC